MRGAAQIVLDELRGRPAPANELYDRVEPMGVSRTAAASALSRLVKSDEVRRARLRLEHGRSIVYIDGDLPDVQLLRRLNRTGFGGRPSLTNVIDCVSRSHASLTLADIAKVAGLTVGHGDRPSFEGAENVATGLEELGALASGRPIGRRPVWLRRERFLKAAGLLADDPVDQSVGAQVVWRRMHIALVRQVAEWLWKNGFASKKGTQHVGGEREIVGFYGKAFDILAFSHLPAMRHAPKSPRAIVGDVLPGPCSIGYARGFVDRVVASRSRGRPPFAFILASVFAPSAHTFLKDQHVVAWTHAQFFNEGLAAAIASTLEAVRSFATAADLDPHAFEVALDGAKHFGGLFGNLKGTMFELLVGHVLRAKGHSSITLGWQLESGLDVDVVSRIHNVAYIVECKGYRSDRSVAFGDVRRHIAKRVPEARSSLQRGTAPPRAERFVALLVATSSIEVTSAGGQSLPGGGPQTTVELWDRTRLRQELDEMGLYSLKGIVARYYASPD